MRLQNKKGPKDRKKKKVSLGLIRGESVAQNRVGARVDGFFN